MSDENEIRLPTVDPSPEQPPNVPQDEPEGCFLILGKIIIVIVIGAFVIGGLIFATCFLGMRR